ncbi:hypothetical protein, partial [Bacillus thuringiensis]|uniref:hypothetical protein n=8 Tax=Bacteria TaxID=2 RepID=UPI00366B4DBD
MCILEEIGFTTDQYMMLHNRGMRDYEIARNQLDVPLETLVSWKVKNNLEKDETEEKQKPYYFTVEEWKQAKAQGMLEKEVAKEFGFTNFAEYYDYKDIIGIPKQGKIIQRTPELLEQIKKYAAQGLSQNQIAAKLDVPISGVTVGTIIKEQGFEWKNRRIKGKKYYFKPEEWEAKRREGKKETEIAKEFGFRCLSEYMVYKRSIGIRPIERKI